jgi:hypothetical protein
MLLEFQNQFATNTVKALRKGQHNVLPAGYAELHAAWVKKNKNLYRDSDAEYMQRFSNHVQDQVKKQISRLLRKRAKKENLSESEYRKLKNLAARGTILLASADGGKTFDQLILPEDLQGQAGHASHTILSPTFRSTTPNLQEVMDEQMALTVAHHLSDYYDVQSVSIDQNHVIKTKLTKSGDIVGAEIDLSQDPSQGLTYNFLTPEGRIAKSVPETQLPEAFDKLPEEPSLPATVEDATTQAAAQSAQAAMTGGIAGAGAAMAGQGLAQRQAAANARAAEMAAAHQAAENARRGMEAPLLAAGGFAGAMDALSQGGGHGIGNVMASKVAVKARMARHAKKLKQDTKRQTELKEHKDQKREKIRKTRRAEEEAEAAQPKKSSGRKKVGGAMAALTGGAVAGGTGLTLFINHINNILHNL